MHDHPAGATRVPRVARALFACAVLSLPACSSSAEPAPPPVLTPGTTRVTTASDVALELTSSPIQLGKNDLGVTLLTPGAELVTVSALMPAHGHGTRPPIVERDAATGKYSVRDLILYMSGRWEVRLDVSSGGTRDDALVVVDVP